MATAVLDLEFEKLPAEAAGLERYSRALVMLRVRGRPVGQTVLPVAGGKIAGMELRDALVPLAGPHVWERRLHDYLEWDEGRATGFVPRPATIAVCTQDRPEDVRRCLEGLMRLPDDGQEILVVENGPAGEATRHIVRGFSSVRYICEDRPGISAARNRALGEARYDIVAFCADNATPDAGWLRALLRNFTDPLVVCVTGPSMPLELETAAQELFERCCPFWRRFTRVILDGNEQDPLQVAPGGPSPSMAFRRNVGEIVGFYDEALGHGTPTRGGEDLEMFARMLRLGYRIVYDPAALSWHRSGRTWTELRRALYGRGCGVYGFLTRSFFVNGEIWAPAVAWRWFWSGQLPALTRSLTRRADAAPLTLLVAELGGCLAGPWAYALSRRQVRRRSRNR
jgi:GT2 family glycosyltransferase